MKKLIIAIPFVMLFVAWVCQVFYVNRNRSEPNYKDYGLNETFEYKGYDITVTGSGRYTMDEYIEKYGVNSTLIGVFNDDEKYFVYAADMEVFKRESEASETNGNGEDDDMVEEKTEGFYWGDIQLLGKGDAWITAPEAEAACACTLTGTLGKMKEGETKRVSIFFMIGTKMYSKKYLEHFEEYPLKLLFLDYKGSPYLRRVSLN